MQQAPLFQPHLAYYQPWIGPNILPLLCIGPCAAEHCWRSHYARGFLPPRVTGFHSNLLPRPTPQLSQTLLMATKSSLSPVLRKLASPLEKSETLKGTRLDFLCLWINLNLHPSLPHLFRSTLPALVLKATGEQYFALPSSPSPPKTLTNP